jgi:hypothetical protein
MSKAASNTIGAKTEKRIIPDVLYDFSHAVMGNQCRTRPTMVMQGDNRGIISWLEAYQERRGEWKLYRRYKDFSDFEVTSETESFANMTLAKQFMQEEIKPAENKDGIAKPFSMMDILYKMAEFEQGALQPGNRLSYEYNILLHDLPGHTLEELGQFHFVAFGQRECIAFDEEKGLPVPSFEGRITGTGTFSDEQEQIIQQAWEAKVEIYGKEGTYLDALAINPKPVSMLNEIYHQMHRRSAYTEIIKYFEDNIFSLFKEIKQYGFDRIIELEREGRADEKVYISEALERIINETLGDNVIESQFGDYFTKDDISNIHKALVTMDIFRCIMHARWAIDVAMNKPEYTGDSEELVADQIKQIQEKYKANGLEAVDENLIMQAILDKDSEQAIEIDSTLERIHNDLITLCDEAAEEASKLQSPKDNRVSSIPNTGRRPNA